MFWPPKNLQHARGGNNKNLIKEHSRFCEPSKRNNMASQPRSLKFHTSLNDYPGTMEGHADSYYPAYSGSHFGMVSDAVSPSADLPSLGAFGNVSTLHYHQGIIDTLNQLPVPASGSNGPEQSTALTSVAQQGTPGASGSHPFECEECHKIFDRFSRLDNCRNQHLGIKPYQCKGRCTDKNWFVSSYFVIISR